MVAARVGASTWTRSSVGPILERGDVVNVVLMGPPGAGKGTQAGTVASLVGVTHVASGDLFRELVQQDNELAQLVQAYMNRGDLVPDDLTVAVVMERIDQDDCQNGFILDGFPRTVGQARALDIRLASEGRQIDQIINLVVPEEVLLGRLSGRWLCRRCHSSYHVEFSPPLRPGFCDRCGGTLYQREDDTLQTAQRRLRVYERDTMPVLDYYRAAGRLVEVDGDRPVGEVSEALRHAIMTSHADV
jgi:adenylate kinase